MTEAMAGNAVAVGTLVGAVLVLAHAMLIAPRRLQVTEHEVALRNLPPAQDGVRLVQLSDLHLGPFTGRRDLRRAVEKANECRPDVIVLTGDFVNFRSMPHFRRGAPELAALSARLGVFACLGNHDHWEDEGEIRTLLKSQGIKVLSNEAVCLEGGLWIAGVDDRMAGEADLAAVSMAAPRNGPVVLLSHNPTVLPEVADRAWLVLSGHSHGGQVGLPFVPTSTTARLPGVGWLLHAYESTGARLHGGRLDAVCSHKYTAGWYQEGEVQLYVNRGVGLNQSWPLRLNCPPEVACFTLRPRQD